VSDLLLVSSRKARQPAVWSFSLDSRQRRPEQPWDKFASEIFTSTGNTRQNGELNYFVLHKDPIDIAETTTQAFWASASPARVPTTRSRSGRRSISRWPTLFACRAETARTRRHRGIAKQSGDINHPRCCALAPTRSTERRSLDSMEDRRAPSPNGTDPKNPYFALGGQSSGPISWDACLVDPVDDVRATNPASNEELFTALSKDFVASGFDVKRLIRAIMNSGAYQLASRPTRPTRATSNITRGTSCTGSRGGAPRRDVAGDRRAHAFAAYPVEHARCNFPIRRCNRSSWHPRRPKRQICDAGERSSEPSIQQALHVINGDTLNKSC
jgi:hypothetical protein